MRVVCSVDVASAVVEVSCILLTGSDGAGADESPLGAVEDGDTGTGSEVALDSSGGGIVVGASVLLGPDGEGESSEETGGQDPDGGGVCRTR